MYSLYFLDIKKGKKSEKNGINIVGTALDHLTYQPAFQITTYILVKMRVSTFFSIKGSALLFYSLIEIEYIPTIVDILWVNHQIGP